MQAREYTRAMRLADLIKEKRTEKNWSMTKLAEKAGISASAVSRLESGEIKGRGETLAKIGNVLGLDPKELNAAMREEQEEDVEVYAIGLKNVPKEDRARLKRIINATVAQFERENNEES